MSKSVKINCAFCKKEIIKPMKEVTRQRKKKGENVNFFCNNTCSIRQGNAIRGWVVCEKEKICPQCNNVFKVTTKPSKKEKICCSSACANKYFMNDERRKNLIIDQTLEKRLQLSEKIKLLQQDPVYQAKMAKQFKEKTHFTSKNEMIIRDFFISSFPEDGQTFGGGLRYNTYIIVRDLYSSKLKVCIEYDGIWHFKDIHGQLEQKQIKDKALEDWCIDNKQKLIRIDENIYKTDPDFQLCELIKESRILDIQVVKFGFRY